MSANAIDLLAGVNVAAPTAGGQVLTATGANTAQWSNQVLGDVPSTADVFAVKDSPTGRTGGGQLVQVRDKNGNPIWAVPPAGGPKTFNDNVSAGVGVFGPFSGWDGPNQAATWDITATNHAAWRIFAGTGVPSGTLLGSNINDWYRQIGVGLFVKTGATTWTQVAGVLDNGGTNTAPSAAAITPTFASGTAAQLSDLTKDYMVYLVIGTGGGTVTIAIGPTAGVANTIVNAAVGVAGTLMSVRLPAGWFYKITLVTSTIASQIAVSC